MAAPAGNLTPSSSTPFDIQNLFNFSNPNPNPNPNPAPLPFHPHPYSAPPPAAFYPPPHFLHPRAAAPPPDPHGARLMALLGTAPSAPPAPFLPQTPPRGRRLPPGDRAVYDVDAKLPGEREPPQLEVTPITKYSSDPALVLGRQIAVNRTYICYGLKQGSIRVLNLNTATRELFKGHTMRVSDMSFFAEDVSLLASASVERRVFVWKIDEGLDEEDKPQITGKIVIAIKLEEDETSCQPRVCWHPHKQEVLVVGIGKVVLKIDTTKVRKGEEFSAENPISCSIDKLIDGVQLIGRHDGEVTDLSMSQWMTTRLVSASKDGTVKIWDDRKSMPLVTLRPHNGQPVYSAAFLTSPQRPDHIVLLTAGPLNRELKIWTSAGDEGWLLPSDYESWQCTQTLDLISSAEPQFEVAFFNQIVPLPKASLLLLANAKKNAIYVVHLDYGPCPSATRMDHIQDFIVTQPILSLTGTIDFNSDGEPTVQVFCVQTQAIQRYALNVFHRLTPSVGSGEQENESSMFRVFKVPGSEGFSVPATSSGPTFQDLPIRSRPNYPVRVSSFENVPSVRFPAPLGTSEAIGTHDFAVINLEVKPSAPPLLGTDTIVSHDASSTVPFNSEVSGSLTGMGISPFGQGSPLSDRDAEQKALDSSAVIVNTYTDFRKEESKGGSADISTVPNSSTMFMAGGNTRHLITPAEILSASVSSSESSLVIQDLNNGGEKFQDASVDSDAERQVEVDDTGFTRGNEFVSPKESLVLSSENKGCSSQTMKSGIEVEIECLTFETESSNPEKARAVENHFASETFDRSPNVGEEVKEASNDVLEKTIEPAIPATISLPSADNVTNQMAKSVPGSAISTPFSSPFTSTNSSNEPESSCRSADAVFSQLKTMQEMLSQLMNMQKETNKQISAMVSSPITKEGRRLEVSLGRSMEKSVKANVDALWGHFQEENAKHQNLERDRVHQITNVVTNCINKDLPAMLEKTIKKEMSGVAPVIARAANPTIEKSISSAIVDSFQRGVGDKTVNQLEKSVSSKLEATVARQIQTQFQTSGKQALQDGLRSCLESKVIPAFENGCKVMFEQVHAFHQKGMAEYTTAALEKIDSTHSPLALTLRETINSASAITRNLSSEVTDSQRNILALVTAGNTKVLNPIAIQQSKGLPSLHHEMLEKPFDPKRELTRLLSEHKYEEAFTLALQRSDVSIVSWVCSQVDMHGICSMSPLPLSQGVLLSLLQQLACDISNETSHKVGWMRDVAVAINPTDPMITPHVRKIFEQVYSLLLHHRSIPTITASDSTSIQVTMHVINSLLRSCK